MNIHKPEFAHLPATKKHRKIAEMIEPGARVIDVGAGFGGLLKLLQDKGCICKGFDLEPFHVEVCQSKGLDVIHGNADAFDTQPELISRLSETYDVVIFSKLLPELQRKNELVQHINADVMIVHEASNLHWKRLLGLNKRMVCTHPFRLRNSDREIGMPMPGDIHAWGESFGYQGRFLFGRFFGSRDLAIRFSRG